MKNNRDFNAFYDIPIKYGKARLKLELGYTNPFTFEKYKDYEGVVSGIEELYRKKPRSIWSRRFSRSGNCLTEVQEKDLLEDSVGIACLLDSTGSTEMNLLGARLIDQSDATFYELRRPLEGLRPWVSDEQIKVQCEARIKEIRNQEILSLDTEWKEIQQTWSDFVNGLTKVEVEDKLSELKSQQISQSDPELVSQIHQYKIDVMLQYLSQLNELKQKKDTGFEKLYCKAKRREDLNNNQVQQDIVFFRVKQMRSKEAETP